MVVNCNGVSFPKRSFRDGEIGGGRGDMNAICSRPEVAGDAFPAKL